ncbi:hypothetical protein MRX96_034135 [Rhipicephalus microplus]
MIPSRKDVIYLIGIHMVPNIVGIARFSYGFHRTASHTVGLVFDVVLGIECALNIFSDTVVILLLWQVGAVSNILGAFVVWNTLAMLFCCGANLAGLRYPPKWFTAKDADQITFGDQLYYTTMLYAFYKTYAATGGRAFGDVSAARRTPGHETQDGEPAHTGPQQRRFPQPEIDPAIIYRDPTPIIGRTPASGLSPVAPSPMHPGIRKQLPAYTISPVPPSFNHPAQGGRLYAYPTPMGTTPSSPVPAGSGFPATQQSATFRRSDTGDPDERCSDNASRFDA